MSIDRPTPDEARAVLAKVSLQDKAVRESDLNAWSLLVLAGVLVMWTILVAAFHGGIWFYYLFLPIALTVGTFRSWQRRRQLAFSRASRLIHAGSVLAYVVWTAALAWWNHESWQGQGMEWRFIAVGLASVLPLLAGALLLRSRR